MIEERTHSKLPEVVLQEEPGTMNVLSVGRGDMKINFNSDNPEEVEQAKSMVRDMLRSGYMIFVEVEEDGKKVTKKVHDFDEKHCEYVIRIDKRTKPWKNRDKKSKKGGEKGKGKDTERHSARTTKSRAVAPTGGG